MVVRARVCSKLLSLKGKLKRLPTYPYLSEIASWYLLALYLFGLLPYFISDFSLIVGNIVLLFTTMGICATRKFRNAHI